MPEATVDESAATPQGTTDADTQGSTAAESELAPDEGMTGADEAGSGEVTVESLQKEIAELKRLKGKMGNELGEYRKRHGDLYPDESNATADDTGADDAGAATDEAESEPDAETRAAAETQLGNELSQAILMGDMKTVRAILGSIARNEAQGVVNQSNAAQSERARCLGAYKGHLADDVLAKHDRAAMKLVKQGTPYGMAFQWVARGDLAKAHAERGAKEKEKELTAGNGGRVPGGGRPSKPGAGPSFLDRIKSAKPANQHGGDFSKL